MGCVSQLRNPKLIKSESFITGRQANQSASCSKSLASKAVCHTNVLEKTENEGSWFVWSQEVQKCDTHALSQSNMLMSFH